MSISRRNLLVGASALAALVSLPAGSAPALASWFDQRWFAQNWFCGPAIDSLQIIPRIPSRFEADGWIMSRNMIRTILGYVNGRLDESLDDFVDDFREDHEGNARDPLDILSLLMFPEAPPMPREESAALWRMFEARSHLLDAPEETLFLNLREDPDDDYDDPIDITRIGDITICVDSEEGLCPHLFIGSTRIG